MSIVTVSEWLSSIVNESFLGDYPVSVIYNGIDTEIFRPVPSGIREKYNVEDKFIILSVASKWNAQKGLNELLNLALTLGDEYCVMVIGLEDHNIDLPRNVISVSHIGSQDELAKYYSGADVYINMSIEETFGLVVAEALACGTPAIVMNSSACPEVIDVNTGIVVEPHDADALVQAIDEIKTNGKDHYSHKCRERIKECFDLNTMQKHYFELYVSLGESNEYLTSF